MLTMTYGVILAVGRDTMTKSGVSATVLMMVFAVALTACGGGGAHSTTAVRNTTVSKGQELIDLKNALDQGALTQREYERQRQQILDQ